MTKVYFEDLSEILLHKSSMAETPRHGDTVADTENVLQTVFVFNNANSVF